MIVWPAAGPYIFPVNRSGTMMKAVDKPRLSRLAPASLPFMTGRTPRMFLELILWGSIYPG